MTVNDALLLYSSPWTAGIRWVGLSCESDGLTSPTVRGVCGGAATGFASLTADCWTGGVAGLATTTGGFGASAGTAARLATAGAAVGGGGGAALMRVG